MQRVLGIDLGTTNSVMAHMTKGDPVIITNRDSESFTPSVVARSRRGEWLVGTPAKGLLGSSGTDAIYSIKRFMGRTFTDDTVQAARDRVRYAVAAGADGDLRVALGGREYTPVEVSAIILQRLKEDAEARCHERFARAVITVPAYFGERQVAATREAGRLAGFHVLRIINEPTAAALAFGLDREDEEGKTVLVYDLGGGTFDISILVLAQGVYSVLGIEGDNFLGGDDFDHLLLQQFLDEIRSAYDVDLSRDTKAWHKLREVAESTKIALSRQQGRDVYQSALGSKRVDLETVITRVEFEAMIEQQLQRTIHLTRKAMRDANLTPDLIDYVLLVGGSTAIPRAAQLLSELFGTDKIRRDVDPMQCVAIGAAIQASVIAQTECPACYAENSVHADACSQCGEALVGKAKISCPTCFIPCDIEALRCWKCGSALDGKSDEAGIDSSTYKAASAEPGGLKCKHCGQINAQGARICSTCGRDLRVTDVLDRTPFDLGIELQDGSMSVLLEKGTGIPTLEMKHRMYYTTEAGQRRLDIGCYEGDRPSARENQLCGMFSYPLPTGLPRGTEVGVACGLDADRTWKVEVTARIPNARTMRVQLQRGVRDPEQMRKTEQGREQVSQFVDRWQEELTEAERRELERRTEQLDQALSAGGSAQAAASDEAVAEAERLLRLATEIRGTDARVSNILFAGGSYLKEEERAQLEHYKAALERARERADWDEGERLYQEADGYVAQLNPIIQYIVNARLFALQNKLSPALANRVLGALRDIDEGIEQGDQPRSERGLETLLGLGDAMSTELSSQRMPSAANYRPDDRKS